LYRELNALAKAGLLIRSEVGNQVHYQANPSCPIYEEMRAILRKTFGIADVLREALEPVAGRIKLAFVYGSVARGEERAASDVDVLLIGRLKFTDAVLALSSAEQGLRREVNPHVYSVAEFQHKVADREPFLVRVMKEPKIYLIGTDDDFGKLVKHRPAEAA
jgi:predicted nucleotidyltransferase